MTRHLAQISARTEAGRHAVVIMDGAGWHQASLVEDISKLSNMKLQPYSPELNPIEQVWSWMRQHHLVNRCSSGYEDIVNSCSTAWNNFISDIKKGYPNVSSSLASGDQALRWNSITLHSLTFKQKKATLYRWPFFCMGSLRGIQCGAGHPASWPLGSNAHLRLSLSLKPTSPPYNGMPTFYFP